MSGHQTRNGIALAVVALALTVGTLVAPAAVAAQGADLGPRPSPMPICFLRPDGSYFCK
jgi:hypothetical protein